MSCGFLIRRSQVRVTPAEIVEQAEATGVKLIGMSALLTTTMPNMEKMLKALTDAGVTAKIMMGVVAVTQGCADKIDADDYDADSAAAVDLVKRLIA